MRSSSRHALWCSNSQGGPKCGAAPDRDNAAIGCADGSRIGMLPSVSRSPMITAPAHRPHAVSAPLGNDAAGR